MNKHGIIVCFKNFFMSINNGVNVNIKMIKKWKIKLSY